LEIVAKVARDNMLEGWKFSEPGMEDFSREYGSGYPSDPKCKTWMATLHDPVFGYNDFMRFSWAPAKNKVKEQGVPVTFQADIDEDEQMQQLGLSAFLGGAADGTSTKRRRLGYFKKRNLQVVNKLLLKV
jgi:ribonuclease H2 subunit A